MESNHNKLLLSQITKHFGSFEHIPKELQGIIGDINDTYKKFEDAAQLLQNSINERKQTEEALQNERTLFRTIIDLIPDAVYVKDTDGRKIIANPKEVQYSGKTYEDEIIG